MFIYDIIGIVPLITDDYFSGTELYNIQNLLHLLYFFKYQALTRKLERIYKIFDNNMKIFLWIELFKLIIIIFLIAHLFGLLYYVLFSFLLLNTIKFK